MKVAISALLSEQAGLRVNARTAGVTDVQGQYFANDLSVEMWWKAEVAEGVVDRQRVALDIDLPAYVFSMRYIAAMCLK